MWIWLQWVSLRWASSSTYWFGITQSISIYMGKMIEEHTTDILIVFRFNTIQKIISGSLRERYTSRTNATKYYFLFVPMQILKPTAPPFISTFKYCNHCNLNYSCHLWLNFCYLIRIHPLCENRTNERKIRINFLRRRFAFYFRLIYCVLMLAISTHLTLVHAGTKNTLKLNVVSKRCRHSNWVDIEQWTHQIVRSFSIFLLSTSNLIMDNLLTRLIYRSCVCAVHRRIHAQSTYVWCVDWIK